MCCTQLSVLDEAAELHPNSWWWIKGDGVDLQSGLGESMRKKWSGDLDLNDGKLQKQYASYMEELSFIQNHDVTDKKKLLDNLCTLSANIIQHREFVTESKLFNVNYLVFCFNTVF